MTALAIQDWFEQRIAMRDAFLHRVGWGDVPLSAIGEDCAFRRYFRLVRDGRTAILMEAVPDGDAIATPGHNIHDFIRISTYLRSIGVRAPDVYEADEENGYLLLEDFGYMSFKEAMAQNVPAEELYGLATDLLVLLRERAQDGDIKLPSYYDSHVHKGRCRLVDWYLPCIRREQNADGLTQDYLSVWDSIEQSLPPVPSGFLHIDYHFENLMWMPDREGTDRAGVLDFQGAMTGPLPYDLANLLEDARVNIPGELRRAMLNRFCAGMTADEKDTFENWYRVLATQFHCRVAGQFIRLALHDGKDRYLAHLPRVLGYIDKGLAHPVLAPLKDWLVEQGFNTSQSPDISDAYIRPDAF